MSTDHQKYSTENQLDVIRSYAVARGLQILRVFEDSGRSGLRLDGREALQNLMAEVQSGHADFKAILVYDVIQNKLRGRKLALVRRLIQQRELRGPQLQNNPLGRRIAKRALTSEGLVRAYQQEATRQKLLIKKAELTQSRLMFVREAFQTLCTDAHFMTLLRAEGLETMPADLARSVTEGALA